MNFIEFPEVNQSQSEVAVLKANGADQVDDDLCSTFIIMHNGTIEV